MPSFLTQCPHCLTSFRVTDAQLDAAEGLVRCGACLGIFSAAANRIILKQTPGEGAAFATDGIDEETDEFEDDAEPECEDDEFDDDGEPEFADEPIPPAPQVAAHSDPKTELIDSDDVEVSLGDFNLDGHEELHADDEYAMDAEEDDEEEEFDEDEEEEYEDDEDEASADDTDDFDDEDDVEDDSDTDAEPEDDADLDATDAIYEEYPDDELRDAVAEEVEEDAQPEEFEPEIPFDDEDADFIDAGEAALAAADGEEEAQPPAPLPGRITGERTTNDKSELRRYLAEIENDEALGVIDDEDALAAIDEPVMLHSAPRRSWLVGFALFAANVVLAGVLLLQYADANIDALGRNARFAPMLPYVCRVLECPATDRSQLRLLVSEQVLVRSHPRLAEALEVNLVFRNDAAVAQPFPALELGFSDSSNRLLANRLFKPAEYLPPELRTSEMPAQSSLQVTLELADPGSEAVNYTLAFRAPE